MRSTFILALAAAALGLGLVSPEPASAGWRDRATCCAYSGVNDPYLYRYEPRGYYPYYNSRYWRPRGEVLWKNRSRFPLVQPPYYAAWGYPVGGYTYVRRPHWRDGYIRREHW